ncbi:MAG: D-glycero-beta-D-manno-heptose-7-phosphate kinase [Elusimicrobiota bacterium]
MIYSREVLRRLAAIPPKFAGKRILVLGDLMLDQFIRGRVSRLSPEAPVPVVQVSQEAHAPGGAGNVCSNLRALGAQVSVFGVLGEDLAGQNLLSDLQKRGIDVSGLLSSPSRRTTQKCRVVAEHQQVVRFDRETVGGLAAGDASELLRRLKAAVGEAQGLVISDYGKGVVTSAVVQAALRLAHRTRLPVLVDPKVEHFKRYRGVDCITPNLQEAWGGMRLHPSSEEDAIRSLGRKILAALRVRSVLITRGEKGMTLFQARGPLVHIPTQAKEVYDVTGAGDTVVSVMALSLACQAGLADSAALSNVAAGIVVGKLGTATVSAAEIETALREMGGRRA